MAETKRTDAEIPFTDVELRNHEVLDALPMGVNVRFNRNVTLESDIPLFLAKLQEVWNRQRAFFILFNAESVTRASVEELEILKNFLDQNESTTNAYCKALAVVVPNVTVLAAVRLVLLVQRKKKPSFPYKFFVKLKAAKDWLRNLEDKFTKLA